MMDIDAVVSMITAHVDRRAAFIAEDEAACLASGKEYPAPGLRGHLLSISSCFAAGEYAEGLRRYIDHLHETDSSMRAQYFTMLQQFAAHLGVDAEKLAVLRRLDDATFRPQ